MPSDPFAALTFITGPAILTNACAILGNGVNIRYSLAITQWREFQASVAEHDGKIDRIFVDPQVALGLAERRVHLQLRALDLVNAAAALFGATTVCGLIGAYLVQAFSVPAAPVRLLTFVATAAALAVMLGAIAALFREGACGRSMIRLHHPAADEPAAYGQGSPDV